MKFPWTRPSDSDADAQSGEEAIRVTLDALIGLSASATALRWRTPASVRAMQSGRYLSRVKGRGMEFDEVRPYQPGDDVRRIDWRVTARTGQGHTKLFREERERPVLISVDYRAPMFFATRGVFKSVMAARLAGLLAWCANHHGDRVGGQVFSEGYHHDFKPQNGKQAVLRLLHYLVDPSADDREAPAAPENALQRSMARLVRHARPGSLVVLISDFRKVDPVSESHLVRIARHCDVILIDVYDPLERELPPGGRYTLSDGGRELVLNTQARDVTSAYRERFLRRHEHLQRLAQGSGMTLLSCATTDDPVQVLRQGIRPLLRSA